ncbi:MAG TPA: TIM-barrel domain-containing protein [Thermoleophilaceae bacterium]
MPRALRIAPAVLALLAAVGAAPAGAASVETSSGPLTATVSDDPWHIELRGPGGVRLAEHAGTRLGYRTAAGWSRASRAIELRREGDAIAALVQTDGGGELHVRIRPAGEGAIAIEAEPAGGGGGAAGAGEAGGGAAAAGEAGGGAAAQAFGIGFDAPAGERFFGFGSRSDAVDHRGLEVENYVSDGPTRPEDRQYPRAVVPPWSHGERDDSTYYPVPWMLSSRGYGVLVDRDETSRFRLASADERAWDLEVDAPALALRVFAGPTPADALRRFTAATGRQPPPSTAWAFGPWFQTGQPNRVELAQEAEMIRAQREADAPVSAAETQMHFLPCGAHRDDPGYNAARTRQFHAAGLAHLVYFNPSLCTSYQPVWSGAAAQGLLIREASGQPHVYPAFVGGSGPAGFTTEPLSQFDFTNPATGAYYESLLRQATDGGHDGWMQDFGEGAPPQGVASDGTTGSALHNRYPTDYHCAVQRAVERIGRPVVRHQRSGWTGAARCASDVWGGDPTTVWDYDGLASGLKQALGIGMSGVSRFGTDIGGYNTYGPGENLTPELLVRWIELGAVSAVMRTKYSGLAVPSYRRPQVFDPGILPVWRRYTKLHTQLYPYILAADATYRASGLPLMRHLALEAPGDPRAVAADDQLLFGPDLLAAPVVEPGARERRLYAPRGGWIDWWRSVSFKQGDGSFQPRAARLLEGGREHTLPAPPEELPLLARAGSVLPMLSPDVDTLAPYRAGRVVRLADREDRLTLLAFPRGRWRGGMLEGERLGSAELRGGGWRLGIDGARPRSYTVRASLAALARPFRPCRVTLGPSPLPRGAWSWRPRQRVLTAKFATRSGSLRALPCARRASS